jgi:FAD/FMN-containing dehydrogenase
MSLSRRDLLKLAGAATVLPVACRGSVPDGGPVVLNDVHSKLNPTRVTRVARPRSVDELATVVGEFRTRGGSLSIGGGRHAMGGQQFGTDSVHIDTRSLRRVLELDRDRGILEVEAGIQWPELVAMTRKAQKSDPSAWGIVQKQTGADRLTLGGAIAANVHGRGLALRPFIADVESFDLLDAAGAIRRCSRTESPELFSLVAGGYGLFGIVTSLRLRLRPRVKLERVVAIRAIDGLPQAFEERIRNGFLYGDFQFKTDETASDFMSVGVFSCYRPVGDDAPDPRRPLRLRRAAWKRLLELAHFDKARAYEEYADYYLKTSGQTYWSDLHQLSVYMDDYHTLLDRRADTNVPGTEMISEVYVPRSGLVGFMSETAAFLRSEGANLIYGTIRLIEPDEVSFLRWASERFACIVFNLHVDHDPAGIERAKGQFQGLIDLALAHRGSFFLTYHRWANRQQVETAYPQFADFLRRKRQHDPAELFQSDWYRHYRALFA